MKNDNNDKYQDLNKKMAHLLKLYAKTLEKSVEVFDDIEEIIANENYSDDMKNNLSDFLNNDKNGKLMLRLILALQYVTYPEEQEVVSNLAVNIVDNNAIYIKDLQDLFNLFDFNKLMNLETVNFNDFDDDSYYDDEDDYEIETTYSKKKKRLLN